jgi:hypothetical protein
MSLAPRNSSIVRVSIDFVVQIIGNGAGKLNFSDFGLLKNQLDHPIQSIFDLNHISMV